jgi:putative heme-binding domain-containing protein
MASPPSMRHLRFLFQLFAFTAIGLQSASADWEAVTVPITTAATASKAAWYRCYIRVPDNMVTPQEKDLWRDSITLSVGGIHGPFTVLLNGREIAGGSAIPDGQRRRFKVPKGILEKQKFNALVVRLEGNAARDGLKSAPILAGYFDELPLEGSWQRQDFEPEASALMAIAAQPDTAFYTETGFRQSSTPLSANPEPIRGEHLPPADSLKKMEPANDLTIDLVASEPDVAQPTHISFDERGRMWVAQYRQYPYPAGVKMISRDKYYRGKYDRMPPPPPKHDRGADIISVHEDTNGDGTFDRSRVVLDGLNMANAALRGHGGIWVMHTPYVLFYPDANGDDAPDRDPEVRLAGFGLEDTHSVANGLVWGPDGWLYGAQGSTTTSRVIRPGVDPEGFAGIYHEGCMVWRYHPQSKAYEIFAEGGGNVFELDFDSEGRLFSGHNGGDTRGWHYVQSGLHLKQGLDPGKFGPSANTFAFGQLEMMKSRNPIQRFTHATIVGDGTALPSRYAGRFLAADPLHRNIILAERYPRGSTFETSDSGAALSCSDPAFRPVYITNAPDGAIYIADFCEEFIAHGQHYQGQIDPGTGRIYRLRGRDLPLEKDTNLASKTTAQLISLLSHQNRWHRQTAVRLLAERRDESAITPLREALRTQAEHPSLEALWVLHQLGALDEATALETLGHSIPAIRAWCVRLVGDSRKLPGKFASAVLSLCKTEPDPEVRAQIASTARRLPSAQAIPVATALLQRDEDIADPYVPLLCWWTLESHCATAREEVMAAIPWESASAQKNLLPRIMRRFAASETRSDLLACAKLLEIAPAGEHRRLLMSGFEEAFKGRALPPLPEPLVDALSRSELASSHLRVRLREPKAVADALKVASDPKAKLEDRLLCIRLFGEVKLPECVPALLQIVTNEKQGELRKAALSALLLYDDFAIGEKVAAAYSTLPVDAQPAAQALLTSRASWSLAFLKLVESGVAPTAQLPPELVSRLRAHENADVAKLAKTLFAEKTNTPAEERRKMISQIRAVVDAGAGDPYKGEALFQQRCSACHTLFFKGGRIGPDLTSYQRDDLGTLLTSILDPNAEIREGFRNQVVTTKDGRTLSGVITASDTTVIVLRGFDGNEVSIPRAEMREAKPTGVSLMPEGLLQGLNDQQIRDFFAYLRIPQPITR